MSTRAYSIAPLLCGTGGLGAQAIEEPVDLGLRDVAHEPLADAGQHAGDQRLPLIAELHWRPPTSERSSPSSVGNTLEIRWSSAWYPAHQTLALQPPHRRSSRLAGSRQPGVHQLGPVVTPETFCQRAHSTISWPIVQTDTSLSEGLELSDALTMELAGPGPQVAQSPGQSA